MGCLQVVGIGCQCGSSWVSGGGLQVMGRGFTVCGFSSWDFMTGNLVCVDVRKRETRDETCSGCCWQSREM